MTLRVAVVTGGGGFLGHQLAQQLKADGWLVRLLDQAERPSWTLDLGVDYRRADVCDRSALAAAMESATVVVHSAFARPDQPTAVLERVNVGATRQLLELACAGGSARVVLVSSTVVDRPLRPHPLLAGAPLTRLAVYRQTRVEAEDEAHRAAARGLSVAVARPKTLLGPGRTGAFSLLFELIRRGGPVPVAGDGHNRYQLLDVRDLAAGLSLLAGSEADGCFSFGAATFATVAEDLATLVAHAGTGARLRFLPGRPTFAGMRAWELLGLSPLSEWHHLGALGKDSVVDIARSEKELGWRPTRGNADLLEAAYDWFESQPRDPAAPGSGAPIPFSHRLLGRVGDAVLRFGSTIPAGPGPGHVARDLEERAHPRERRAEDG